MKKTSIFFFVVSVFFAFYFTNSAFSLNVESQYEEPEEYIIQKGDTLWSISKEKLDDTFLWPRLWNVNPHISHPDRIYPGLKIRIPSREELLRLPYPPKPEPEPEPEPIVKPKPKPKLKPKVVIEPPKAPPKYIISKKLYIKSGWISKEYPSIGEITGTPTGRNLVAIGDTVYLKINKSEAMSGPARLVVENSKKRYFTIRKIKKVDHPSTGKKMGHQIRITGILEVIGKDSDSPKAKIIESFEEILTGDGLMPYEDMPPPIVPDPVRTPDIKGYIVESHMNSRILRRGNIVYLDKGERDGIQTGNIFTSVSETRPKRNIGTLQIISLQPDTSTAFILDSQEEIVVGSRWEQKR